MFSPALKVAYRLPFEKGYRVSTPFFRPSFPLKTCASSLSMTIKGFRHAFFVRVERIAPAGNINGLLALVMVRLLEFLSKRMNMMDYHPYKACIDACLRCAAVCDHCAASCTREDDVKMMTHCIQLDMECAVICYTAARLMSMQSLKTGEICRICASICEACAHECDRHTADHCRDCAEACRVCEQECRRIAC